MLLPHLHRHESYTKVTSVNTGMRLWVPNAAVPMLTDSARKARCAIHGLPLADADDDNTSIIDVIAQHIIDCHH